jgi:pimeloyl-ACP methyl ester carboxylesterase
VFDSRQVSTFRPNQSMMAQPQLFSPCSTHGRTTVADPDRRGHGASFGSEPSDLSDYAADLFALRKAFDLQRPIIVGHSLGGMIAIQACLEQSTFFEGLAVLASSPKPKIGDHRPIMTGVSNLSDPIRPDDPLYACWHHCRHNVPVSFLKTVAEEASKMPANRWPAILGMIRRIDLREQAPRLAYIEMLIIGGSGASCSILAIARYWRPRYFLAEFLELDGRAHNLHWGEPARVAASIFWYFFH